MEAPGTAPGSATLIPSRVYRHSHRSDEADIGVVARDFEGGLPRRQTLFDHAGVKRRAIGNGLIIELVARVMHFRAIANA